MDEQEKQNHDIFLARLHELAGREGSMNKLAEAVGVHHNTMYRVTSSEDAYLSIPIMRRIAEHFGVTVDWLLGR